MEWKNKLSRPHQEIVGDAAVGVGAMGVRARTASFYGEGQRLTPKVRRLNGAGTLGQARSSAASRSWRRFHAEA